MELGVTVPCAYDGCGLRRPHWEQPHDQRHHRMVEVEDGFTGRAFCSLECHVYWQASERQLTIQDAEEIGQVYPKD